MRVLLSGESWVTHSIRIKGVDSFNTRCPPDFMNWAGCDPLWANLIRWLSPD